MIIDYFYSKMDDSDLQRIIKMVGDDLEGQFESVPFFTNRYFYMAKKLNVTDETFILEYLRHIESFLSINKDKDELSKEVINIVEKSVENERYDELLPIYNKIKNFYENYCKTEKYD